MNEPRTESTPESQFSGQILQLPSVWQVTVHQISIILNSLSNLARMRGLFLREAEGEKIPEGGVLCALDVLCLRLFDRLEEIVTDKRRWTIGPTRNLEKELQAFIAQQRRFAKLTNERNLLKTYERLESLARAEIYRELQQQQQRQQIYEENKMDQCRSEDSTKTRRKRRRPSNDNDGGGEETAGPESAGCPA